MDAVKFLEETRRMCDTYDTCEGCPADARGNFVDCRVDIMQAIDAADAVAIVEEWSKEHPIKTRNSEFLKHYPNADVLDNGVTNMCPNWVDKSYRPCAGCNNTKCYDCKTEYWMQEVE